ncbi:hypothetical protein EB001_14840 [bacterium]|nr:hypothetical protein [bacterium]
MSGGYFDYKQYEIENIADELEQIILDNDSEEKDEWGYSKGRHYSAQTIEQFKIGLEHLRKAQIYLHRIDWLLYDDDDENSFHERLFEELNGEIK